MAVSQSAVSELLDAFRAGGSVDLIPRDREPAGVLHQVRPVPWKDHEMPARKEHTPEFKDQAVRFVLEEIGPDESRKQACERLGPGDALQLGEAVGAGEGPPGGVVGFGRATPASERGVA
jgi:hypothetical protein